MHSVPGQGSEFRVGIPLPVAGDMPAGELVAGASGDPRDAVPVAGVDATPLRVLAIEDHPASRLLLADQFRELGVDATSSKAVNRRSGHSRSAASTWY